MRTLLVQQLLSAATSIAAALILNACAHAPSEADRRLVSEIRDGIGSTLAISYNPTIEWALRESTFDSETARYLSRVQLIREQDHLRVDSLSSSPLLDSLKNHLHHLADLAADYFATSIRMPPVLYRLRSSSVNRRKFSTDSLYLEARALLATHDQLRRRIQSSIDSCASLTRAAGIEWRMRSAWLEEVDRAFVLDSWFRFGKGSLRDSLLRP